MIIDRELIVHRDISVKDRMQDIVLRIIIPQIEDQTFPIFQMQIGMIVHQQMPIMEESMLIHLSDEGEEINGFVQHCYS